jgi:hypothetical protein
MLYQTAQSKNEEILIENLAIDAWKKVFSFLDGWDHRKTKQSCSFFKNISNDVMASNPILYNQYKKNIKNFFKDPDIFTFQHDKGGKLIRTIKILKNGCIISGTYKDMNNNSQLCMWKIDANKISKIADHICVGNVRHIPLITENANS